MRYVFLNTDLRRNQFLVYKFLFDRFNGDWEYANAMAETLDRLSMVYGSTYILKIIRSFYLKPDIVMKEFFNYFFSYSHIVALIGARRQGKTALMSLLAEEARRRGFYIACYNMSKDLPKWFKHHEYDKKNPYHDVPNKALILHDEVHLDIDSKNWQSKENRKVREFLSTTGHRDQIVIWTSQLASNLSLDFIRYASLKLYKPFSFTQADTDRKEYFEEIKPFLPQDKTELLIHSDDFVALTKNPLPKFYNDKISKAFS